MSETTKAERSEQRERNRRKMKVSGASVRLLHHIVLTRAEKAKAEQKKGPDKQSGRSHIYEQFLIAPE